MPPPGPTRAVCLGFDGVLADAANVHVAAWERTFAAMGWNVPADVAALAAGRDDRALVAELFAARGVDGGDVAGWVARKQALAERILSGSPRLIAGAAELLAALNARGVPAAIVTGTWRANVEAVLRAAGLGGRVAQVVAKEDVASPKPDPEAYRLAVARLGVPAGSVVALDDDPAALAGARSVGLRAIALGTRIGVADWSDVTAYLGDLRDTRRALAALGIGA